jgi:hypothetical protein
MLCDVRERELCKRALATLLEYLVSLRTVPSA